MTAAFYRMMLAANETLQNLLKQTVNSATKDTGIDKAKKRAKEFAKFIWALHNILVAKLEKVLSTQSPRIASAVTYLTTPMDIDDLEYCDLCWGCPLNLPDASSNIEAAEMFLDRNRTSIGHFRHRDELRRDDRCICAYIESYRRLLTGIVEKGRALLQSRFAEDNIPKEIWEYPVYYPEGMVCLKTNHAITSEISLGGVQKDCLGRNMLHRYLDSLYYDSAIEQLLATDIDIDAEDIIGRTPLFIACQKGFLQVVTDLLKKGAYSSQYYTSWTISERSMPLIAAAAGGFTLICRKLLETLKFNHNDLREALHHCVRRDQLLTYRFLVGHRSHCFWPLERKLRLLLAAGYGSIEILEDILREFNTPNTAWDPPGFYGIIALFVLPVQRGMSALSVAAREKQQAAMQTLLRHEAIDVNIRHFGHMSTALHYAAEADFVHGVDFLKQRPELEINAMDGEGRTALVIAAIKGHYSIVRSLLQDHRVYTSLVTYKYGKPYDYRNDLHNPEKFDQIMAQEGRS